MTSLFVMVPGYRNVFMVLPLSTVLLAIVPVLIKEPVEAIVNLVPETVAATLLLVTCNFAKDYTIGVCILIISNK